VRIVGDLRSLQKSSRSRLRRIRQVALDATVPGASPVLRDLSVTYCVIELYNLWYSFSRFLYLSAALGARDGAGVRVTVRRVAPPHTVEDALTHAIRLRPRYQRANPPWNWTQEPRWADTSVLLNCLSTIGASNRQQVGIGVSAPSTVFGELTPFRHFFAHRGRETLRNLIPHVRGHSISTSLRPTDALLTAAIVIGIPRPQPLLLDWVDEVINAVDLSI